VILVIRYLTKDKKVLNSITLDFVREQYLQILGSKNRLVGLIGQRGVGKTTLLLQYLKLNYKPFEYIYFSADEFVSLGGKIIVIDEIHKYQNWSNEIKTIYDSFPELIIRFSGSSMLNILHEKFDLSRRAVIGLESGLIIV